jgi:hypothetical protein
MGCGYKNIGKRKKAQERYRKTKATPKRSGKGAMKEFK